MQFVPIIQDHPSLDNSGYSLIFSHFFQIILAVRSPKPTVDPPFDPGLELSKGGTTWTTAVAAALMDCTWWLVRWFVAVAIWTYLNITLAKGEWPWPGPRFDSYNEKQLMKMCADPQGCAWKTAHEDVCRSSRLCRKRIGSCCLKRASQYITISKLAEYGTIVVSKMISTATR